MVEKNPPWPKQKTPWPQKKPPWPFACGGPFRVRKYRASQLRPDPSYPTTPRLLHPARSLVPPRSLAPDVTSEALYANSHALGTKYPALGASSQTLGKALLRPPPLASFQASNRISQCHCKAPKGGSESGEGIQLRHSLTPIKSLSWDSNIQMEGRKWGEKHPSQTEPNRRFILTNTIVGAWG